jgi:group I intron endonuclease
MVAKAITPKEYFITNPIIPKNRYTCGIYKIVCIETGKMYIGSSKNIRGRWYGHVGKLEENKHHSDKLQNAWNKYGSTSFEFHIIEICIDREIRLNREQQYLDSLDTYNNGYNSTDVVGSPAHSIETRMKMSRNRKGRKLSEEHKRRLSEASQHTPLSKEHIDTLITLNKTRIWSEESRKRMSESKKNPSVDTRQKLRDANLGKKHSEESKKKMSDTRLGKPCHSEESKSKIREAQNRRWAKWREKNGKAK